MGVSLSQTHVMLVLLRVMMMLLACHCYLSPSLGDLSSSFALCGVTLRRSWILSLCNDLSGLVHVFVLDRVAPWASHSGSELINIFLCHSFTLNSCSLKWQWWDKTWVYANFGHIHYPPAVCQSPRHSNHTVDGFFVLELFPTF